MKIDGRIENGTFWIESAEKSALEDINKCLSIVLPNREHMPLYKSGKWDGIKHYFNWRAKSFKVGLMGFVSRKTGHEFQVVSSDISTEVLEYIPVTDGLHQLRDYQEKTVRDMLRAKSGIASLATNAGKTACMAGIIKAANAKGKKIAILEGMISLFDQVKIELELWYGAKLGYVKANGFKLLDVNVVMVQTIFGIVKRIHAEKARDDDYEIYNALCDTDIFMVDECHHVNSNSYIEILELNRKAWRFGFSGTIPPEDDIVGLEIRELLGDVVTTVKNSELIEKEISAKPTIRIISYETEDLEAKVALFKTQIKNTCMKMLFSGTGPDGKPIMKFGFSVPTYTAKVKEFVMNYSVKQSKQFYNILEGLVKKYKDVSTVIIIDWVDLGEELGKFLGVEVLHGQMPMHERNRILNAFKNGRINCLIATSVLDEGISIDRIKVLILATVGSSIRQFLQRIGRGLRKKAEDNTLTVIDFARFGHSYLTEPSRKRIALWKDEGFEIIYED